MEISSFNHQPMNWIALFENQVYETCLFVLFSSRLGRTSKATSWTAADPIERVNRNIWKVFDGIFPAKHYSQS